MHTFPSRLGRTLTIAAAFAIAGAVPALAQSSSSSSSSGSTAPAATSASGNKMAMGDKAPSGSLEKTNGDWRGSEVIGATVYNDQGDSVGTVSDLLMAPDGTVSNAVLSVGGFLGVGSKLVEVPLKDLKFAPSQNNPASGSKMATQATSATTGAPKPAANSTAPAGATGTGMGSAPNDTAPAGSTAPAATATTPASSSPAGNNDFSLVLPGATKQSLTSDPTFKFAD